MLIPNKYKSRIVDYFHDSNGYWIYLKGFRASDNLCHVLHEDTQQNILKELRKTKVCDCDYCRGIE